jgi:hypothetical protein
MPEIFTCRQQKDPWRLPGVFLLSVIDLLSRSSLPFD